MKKIFSLKNFIWLIGAAAICGMFTISDSEKSLNAVNSYRYELCFDISLDHIRSQCIDSIYYNKEKMCKDNVSCKDQEKFKFNDHYKIHKAKFISYKYFLLLLSLTILTYFTHIQDRSKY